MTLQSTGGPSAFLGAYIHAPTFASARIVTQTRATLPTMRPTERSRAPIEDPTHSYPPVASRVEWFRQAARRPRHLRVTLADGNSAFQDAHSVRGRAVPGVRVSRRVPATARGRA